MSESFIVEIPRRHLPVLGQILHLAKEGGIPQAEAIMKDLANQVTGLHMNKPRTHLVFPQVVTAPENAKPFESCFYVEYKDKYV